ncbi:hypothetical protein LX97_03302 [Nonlabens dokdonensis]|uniref:Uncharacterized protein n=2 Tax=Nonlabens dokdonensis TaxID=328515 RepID=L7WDH0_NONDD|nr:hypothetical protein [Nonlabens dokdonensis]AGC76933.1 hypothetical protein DDD_1806 [Nonlabens dokdonensis DSW-6]PZX36839.1 hypothetical protein LX97_03302 [Nonlabens dokdonensis]
MNFWNDIEDCLNNEGFEPLIENESIHWQSERASFNIKYKDIAFEGNRLAWYQDEEYGRCSIKIKYANGIILNWQPKSNHSDFGFRLHYIKWFGYKLIAIYTEKHRTYIVKIENLTVTILYGGNIDKIKITNDRIFVKEFQNNDFFQFIYINSDPFSESGVYCIPLVNLKSKVLQIELESFNNYFLIMDKEYNKVTTQGKNSYSS